MKYITLLNQSRLGDWGIKCPIRNKLNITPEWVRGNKMSKLQELEITETEEFDVSLYVNKLAKIEEMNIETGTYGKFLKIKTNDLGEGVKASMVFGLKTDKDGKTSISDQSKLAEFMKSKKVTDYRKLIGLEVMVLSKAGNDGKDWLYFA